MFKNSIVVAGGGVAHNLPDQLFKDCDKLDAICFGEG